MGKANEVDTRIRLPKSLYEQIKTLSEQERRSINAQMVVLLELAITKKIDQRKCSDA
jgi:hypothetical protein